MIVCVNMQIVEVAFYLNVCCCSVMSFFYKRGVKLLEPLSKKNFFFVRGRNGPLRNRGGGAQGVRVVQSLKKQLFFVGLPLLLILIAVFLNVVGIKIV